MTDRGILFSAPMIKALLAGRKTMTRRLAWSTKPPRGYVINAGDTYRRATLWQNVRAGDRLWVRETFAVLPRNCYALPKTGAPDPDMAAYYRADFDRSGKPGWKPAIHMPRWASRLTLTVTAVKVEPLHAISAADALAEGVTPSAGGWWTGAVGQAGTTPTAAFALLWNSLHGADSWDANPALCCMSFTVEQRNIDSHPIAEARREMAP